MSGKLLYRNEELKQLNGLIPWEVEVWAEVAGEQRIIPLLPEVKFDIENCKLEWDSNVCHMQSQVWMTIGREIYYYKVYVLWNENRFYCPNSSYNIVCIKVDDEDVGLDIENDGIVAVWADSFISGEFSSETEFLTRFMVQFYAVNLAKHVE